MLGTMYLITPYGEITEHKLEKRPNLKQMQDAVGGHIESVPAMEWFYPPSATEPVPCWAIVNEEGKLEGLPVNVLATIAWDRALRRDCDRGFGDPGIRFDVLCGVVAVFTGDALLRAFDEEC